MMTMAVYDLEEQEQLDELKTWWKQYGNLVTTILLVVALAAAGWMGWKRWQMSQASEASAIYVATQQAASRGDAKRVRELAGELIDKYAGTTYASLGALLSAKVQAELGDAKNAKPQLVWAAANGSEDLRDLARLRLAALLLDEKAYDEALKQLAAEPLPPFVSRFNDLKGDIYVAQGKPAEAKAAYEAALAKLDELKKNGTEAEARGYRDALTAKRDAVGAVK
jgi:predicted negative regulator of RcsB-dependent stress response